MVADNLEISPYQCTVDHPVTNFDQNEVKNPMNIDMLGNADLLNEWSMSEMIGVSPLDGAYALLVIAFYSEKRLVRCKSDCANYISFIVHLYTCLNISV